jgi:hypothetical protein
MSVPASFDDVNLILRLYEIRREEKMRSARDWFVRNFKPKSVDEINQIAPPGSAENAYMRQVTSYFEMVASFITSGVLNQELYFQSGGELLLCYIRVRPVLGPMREASKNPGQFGNLEKVGEAYLDWYDKKGEGAREALIARMS